MMIDKFTWDYEFLSNFYPSPITSWGIEFPTVEHVFQAAKVDPASPQYLDLKLQIAGASTPAEAKRLGRNVPLTPAWEQDKYVYMENFLEDKFPVGSKLADKLLGTGNQVLIEGNTWHDQIWGNCTCPQHHPQQGQNALGILLMKVRLYLRAASG